MTRYHIRDIYQYFPVYLATFTMWWWKFT